MKLPKNSIYSILWASVITLSFTNNRATGQDFSEPHNGQKHYLDSSNYGQNYLPQIYSTHAPPLPLAHHLNLAEGSAKLDSKAKQLHSKVPENGVQNRHLLSLPKKSTELICLNKGPYNIKEYVESVSKAFRNLLYAVFPKLDPTCQRGSAVGPTDVLKKLLDITRWLTGIAAIGFTATLAFIRLLLEIIKRVLPILRFFNPLKWMLAPQKMIIKVILGILRLFNPIRWVLFPFKIIIRKILQLLGIGNDGPGSNSICLFGKCTSDDDDPRNFLSKLFRWIPKLLNPINWIKWVLKLLNPINWIRWFFTLINPLTWIRLIVKAVKLPFKILFIPISIILDRLHLLEPLKRLIRLLKFIFKVLRVLLWPIRTILKLLNPLNWIKFIIQLPLLPFRIMLLPVKIIRFLIKIFTTSIGKIVRILLSPIRLILTSIFHPFKTLRFLLSLPSKLIQAVLHPSRTILNIIKWIFATVFNLGKKPQGSGSKIWDIFNPIEWIKKIRSLLGYPVYSSPLKIFNPLYWIRKILDTILRVFGKDQNNESSLKIFNPVTWIKKIIDVILRLFGIGPLFGRKPVNRSPLNIFNPVNWLKKIIDIILRLFGKEPLFDREPVNRSPLSILNPFYWIRKILDIFLGFFGSGTEKNSSRYAIKVANPILKLLLRLLGGGSEIDDPDCTNNLLGCTQKRGILWLIKRVIKCTLEGISMMVQQGDVKSKTGLLGILRNIFTAIFSKAKGSYATQDESHRPFTGRANTSPFFPHLERSGSQPVSFKDLINTIRQKRQFVGESSTPVVPKLSPAVKVAHKHFWTTTKDLIRFLKVAFKKFVKSGFNNLFVKSIIKH